jgi:ribosomal protein L11 methyltransferase
MTPNYIQLDIVIPEALHELLIAELTDYDFEGFDQYDDHLIAWIPQPMFSDVAREEIEQLLGKYGTDVYVRSEKVEEPRNWNEDWEATIQPMTIGRFYVAPTWAISEPPAGVIQLLIDPKMAFGTGYHETTRIMLRMMPEVVKPGDDVMDAGTGTGILAIAAVKLGAEKAFGFDIDEWSFENANENIILNETADKISIALGDDSLIPKGKQYDVVIANINRNILIDMAHVLCDSVKTGGTLLLSGLLHSDEEVILSTPGFNQLKHIKTEKENDWIGLVLKK